MLVSRLWRAARLITACTAHVGEVRWERRVVWLAGGSLVVVAGLALTVARVVLAVALLAVVCVGGVREGVGVGGGVGRWVVA